MNRSIALSLIGLLTIAPVTTVATAIGVQAQAVDARKIEADRLLDEGVNQYKNQNNKVAINTLERALIKYKEINNVIGISKTFIGLGNVYGAMSQTDKAIDNYEKALSIFQRYPSNDNEDEAVALNNLGNVYSAKSRYELSIKNYKKALSIFQKLKKKNPEAVILVNLGNIHRSLALFDQAIQYYESAISIFQESNDLAGRAMTLVNMGNLYSNTRQNQKSAENYQAALSIHDNLSQKNERAIEIPALIGLGKIYYGLYIQLIYSENISDSRLQQATIYQQIGINYYQKAIKISQRIRDYHSQAKALNNLGVIYLITSQNEKSFTYFSQSLLILKSFQDPTAEGISWYTLGGLMKLKNQPEIAISFYKKSVERFEFIRKNLQASQETITPEARSSYTQSVAYIYRDLADILLKQNRTLEALQVLDLLKVQDLKDFLKDVKGNALTAKGVELFPQEEAILTAFNNSSADLNAFLKSSTIQTQTQYLKANAANQNLQLNTYSDLQTRIKKLGKNVALFYPLILDDRLELVVLTADRPPIHKAVAIPKKQLETDIETFRQQLQNRSSRIQEPAQKLYQTDG